MRKLKVVLAAMSNVECVIYGGSCLTLTHGLRMRNKLSGKAAGMLTT